MYTFPVDPAIQQRMPESTRIFTDVTVFDFAGMEAKAMLNKARIIAHEGDKLWRGEQGICPTVGAVVDTLFDPSELYHDFPPSGYFYIERGH